MTKTAETGATVPEDRKYMGTAADAKAAVAQKAKAWRTLRQPLIAPREEHRKREAMECEARFQLANAALLWLWHEENPDPAAVNRDSRFADMVAALEEIVAANDEFRKGMPDDWDGDPLQDACAAAVAILSSIKAST